MENLFDCDHGFINPRVAIMTKEEGRHFPLPAFVYIAPAHFRQGMREIGGFQIPDQESVRSQEEGIIAPTGFAQGADHLRPYFAMPGLVLLQLVGPDVQ